MKVRASVKRLCGFCRVMKQRGAVFIVCTANPKHKERQGFSTLASASQFLPLTSSSSSSAAAAAAAAAETSKIAKQEMSTKFNWPLGLAALLKNGDK